MPHSSKRRHRKRSFIGQLIYDIKKKLTVKKSTRKKHHSRHHKNNELITPQEQIDNTTTQPISDMTTRHSKRPHRRKKRSKKKNFIQDIITQFDSKWKERKHKKKKAKYKKKAKKKLKRKNRKEKWAGFTNQFLSAFKTKNAGISKNETETASKYSKKSYLLYTLNSTVLYMLAYLGVYLVYQFTVLIMASFWGLDSVLFYYDLAFNDLSPRWNRLNIIFITISGPLVALFLGMLFNMVFAKRENSRVLLKLFYLWIAFHGFNMFFGAFSSGVSFDEGFGYVASWLYMNVFWKIFFSLIFLFLMGIIGYYSTSKFLETSNSSHRVKKENRGIFILSQVILPWFLGGLIIFLIRIPNNMPYDTGNLITMIFAVIPMLFNFRAKPEINIDKLKRKQTTINWAIIIIFILVYTAYRVGLDNGLHFLMKFRFSIDITPI
ncbi:MAG: hypothetical protein K8R53_01650 [Bacteroidales bacterium]|nr:hypothetical protein [Bacteroidales bacterium]